MKVRVAGPLKSGQDDVPVLSDESLSLDSELSLESDSELSELSELSEESPQASIISSPNFSAGGLGEKLTILLGL
jgi:hypothetical protein